jgi:agmatine deiminase
MAFPRAGITLGDGAEWQETAYRAWTDTALAIAEFEPVTMLVDPAELAVAKRYVSQDIELIEAPLNDAWMRDIGPTFVHADDGSVAAVDWTFNGWGAQDWARWDRDAKIGATVGELAGVTVVPSALLNEGGGIQTDGHGTVLVTETVQLDPHRNPGATKAGVETELARTIGATDVVWLPYGLTRDSQRYGTRGHVDIIAALTAPGRLLLHTQRDESHPDSMVCKGIRSAVEDRFDIVEMPAPATLTDADGYVDYSYINHLVVNGGVIACAFDDPHDAEARAILAEQYPGREVVAVDARPLFERGGGIHCITQQQPSPIQREAVA